jgi:hypothetical protein
MVKYKVCREEDEVWGQDVVVAGREIILSTPPKIIAIKSQLGAPRNRDLSGVSFCSRP